MLTRVTCSFYERLMQILALKIRFTNNVSQFFQFIGCGLVCFLKFVGPPNQPIPVLIEVSCISFHFLGNVFTMMPFVISATFCLTSNNFTMAHGTPHKASQLKVILLSLIATRLMPLLSLIITTSKIMENLIGRILSLCLRRETEASVVSG
ncbi:unnamed protein product [Trypanosoma congolense IL3000]|uniref:WGS project CAEQ00000000 data, annotated contig 428 n=1 Tax=Trypanosoma congolense (strain IL3000) TaxID=1068625 RepID=F9WFW3_TRYCI|nr:unnamed protein product [Trypanosoma congolense IL3000]